MKRPSLFKTGLVALATTFVIGCSGKNLPETATLECGYDWFSSHYIGNLEKGDYHGKSCYLDTLNTTPIHLILNPEKEWDRDLSLRNPPIPGLNKIKIRKDNNRKGLEKGYFIDELIISQPDSIEVQSDSTTTN